MQAAVFIQQYAGGYLPADAISAQLLPFSPVRLLVLVAWVYLCLYLVQRVQFSPLVPKNHKPIVNLITLFTGPLPLLFFAVRDAMTRSSETGRSVAQIIVENMQSLFTRIKSSHFAGAKDQSRIALLDSSGRGIKEIYGHSKSKAEDRHVLDLTEQIVLDGLNEQASDILIDPKDDATYTVRFRVDGVLSAVRQIESRTGLAVINSIKAVSGMDISERRRPQDGAFTARTAGTTASFRVASAGVLHGEKLSIRVLNQDSSRFSLTNIGLSAKQRALIENAISKPSGMVLLCGPTGSGKTTTLYAMLNELDFFMRNVITVEDPIECVLPNVSQIEVNPRADITFAKSLRSILRQDPDVICVGEIRDEETAAIALRAAQTGHLVLATVHSDTNASALIRLLDLGVSPVLLSSGLNVIVAQRLVRKLCTNCRMSAAPTKEQIQEFTGAGLSCEKIFEPNGCNKCRQTGYKGRIGVFDILVLDDRLKARIASGEMSLTSLRTDGDQKGRSHLHRHGLKLVASAVTNLGELKRVIG